MQVHPPCESRARKACTPRKARQVPAICTQCLKELINGRINNDDGSIGRRPRDTNVHAAIGKRKSREEHEKTFFVRKNAVAGKGIHARRTSEMSGKKAFAGNRGTHMLQSKNIFHGRVRRSPDDDNRFRGSLAFQMRRQVYTGFAMQKSTQRRKREKTGTTSVPRRHDSIIIRIRHSFAFPFNITLSREKQQFPNDL